MSRDNISNNARTAMNVQTTADGFLFKLKIDHPSFGQPYRFIDDQVPADGTGVQKRTDGGGDDWLCFPFGLKLPDDRDDEMASATLTIDNVDREILATLRGISGKLSVSVWICLLTDIDDLVAGPFDFSLNRISWNALTISGPLEYEPILNMGWPAHVFDAVTMPGMFKQ